MPLVIRAADPHDPAVAEVIAAHIAYGDAAYPAESNHHLTPDAHDAAQVMLFAAWQDDQCLGMAGLTKMPDHAGEVKSMHVQAHGRGQGVGAALLEQIIVHARTLGMTRLYLETGSREASAAACRLYERSGFTYCPPFGDYIPDPESVFMTRAL